MKFIKKCLLFLTVATFLVTLSGCRLIKYSYSFTQDIADVISVEICHYDYYNDSTTPIIELEKDMAMSLLEDISELDSYKHFGDHTQDYGRVIVYITYKNGEAEVIGWANRARVDANGEWWIGPYWFDNAEWSALILKYVDEELVPELTKYTLN